MILLDIPGVPPSTNHLYTTIRGRKVLSAGGRKYKHKVATQIAQQFPESQGFTKDDGFHLKIWLVFDIFTKTKGAKNRYKKWDVSNRVKVLEDAICESFGIDDSQIVHLEIEKKCRTGNQVEQTLVTLVKSPECTVPQS